MSILRTALFSAGFVAIGLSQRSLLVAPAPLTPQLRADLDLTAGAISVLTVLPLLCFGLFATVAPKVAQQWGLDRCILGSAALACAGVVVRSAPGVAALFTGSALIGAGVAVNNVLLPAMIKRDFSARTGLALGCYTILLNGGAALASATTVPLADDLHLGWRIALALWGVLPVLGVLLWAPRVAGSPARARAEGIGPRVRLRRSRLAWAVSVFMALQSLLYYALIAWLPSILVDTGMPPRDAGATAAVMSIAGMALSFLVPIVAMRIRSQRSLVALSTASFGIGLVGLIVAPGAAAMWWMLALGVGQGTGIALALSLLVLRTRTAGEAAQLSGMAQTLGYLVAAAGPLMFGIAHDHTGRWTAALVASLVITAVMLAAGWAAGTPAFVSDERPQAGGLVAAELPNRGP
ncbi:MAG TPA: MFS transporter [Mycobacterium sp.]|nr:MFS transporter [Mycobacterium sp.]